MPCHTLAYLVARISQENQEHLDLICLNQLYEERETVGPWIEKNGLLLYKGRLYLPLTFDLITTITEQFHEATYEGLHKTL